MFSQVSVCQKGGVQPPGKTPPRQADTTLVDIPWVDTPPPGRQTPPPSKHPPGPQYGYCSGRYASYKNAFLFFTQINSVRCLGSRSGIQPAGFVCTNNFMTYTQYNIMNIPYL